MGNMTGGGVGGASAMGGGLVGGAGMAGIAYGSAMWRPWRPPIADTEATADLSFLVPVSVPPALLQRATRRGLRAAARATPGRGKVRATGSMRSAGAVTLRVDVALVVRGEGTRKRWALAAEAAFADAFAATLQKKKHEVRRTDAPG